MDINRLPFLSLNFFYYQFSPAAKRLFVGLSLASLLFGALFVWALYDPEFWSIEVREVPDTETTAVVIDSIHAHYRTFDLTFPAYYQQVSYTAGPITPGPWALILFWLGQIAGWSFLLAAATEIRSRWAYLFYFLFVLFLHFSDVTQSLYAGAGYQVLGFAISIGILALAYAFQTFMIRLKFPLRILAFASILLVLFGAVWLKGGWLEWHRMSTTSFSYLFLLGILFLFFIGKEPTNLIIFAGTNRPQRNGRLDYRIILTALLLLLVVEFLALTQYLSLSWAPELDLLIRPAHLIVISSLLMPFLSQNQYHQVKLRITTNLSYTFLLSGFTLIVLSFFFLVISQGDEIFVAAIERLAIIFFFSMGLFHVLFLLGNHFELLRQRINLYYVLAHGNRVPFAVIWFAGILAVVFAEGSESWKTPRLLLYSQTLQSADHALLAGDREAAMQEYSNASFFAPGNIKAHYNQASLLVADPRQLRDALSYYEQATRYQKFPYAQLNAANLLAYDNEPDAAQAMLLKGLQASPANPYLANNLGTYYLAAGMADSAILRFQQALGADISLSSVYGNLAQLYQQYERPEEALAFYRAGVDLRNPSAPAVCNALYYQLLTGQSVLPEGSNFSQHPDYFVRYNAQLDRLGKGHLEEVAAGIKALIAEDPTPGTLLLDAYLMFRQDSVENARSRMKYVAESFPSEAAKAHRLTALAYYQRNVPEMARHYFLLAAAAGDPYGSLFAAKTELDMGLTDSAFVHLSALRVQHPELWTAVAKEMGMLYSAYGQPIIADTEWDMTTLSPEEQIRVACYADTLQSGNAALNHFLAVVDKDSAAIAPYLEMGRIFNRLRDPRAIENLRYGLHLHPENVPMRLELARAFVLQAQSDSAQTLLQAPIDSTFALEAGEVNAELAIALRDTAAAIEQLETIFEADPFRQSVILRLAGLYRSLEAWDKGNQLITQAVNLNDQNPDIWYYYAVFSRAWNLNEDAGYGAIKAIELTPNPRRRQAITTEFETEIREAASGF